MLTMYDAIDVANLPAGADAYAGYTGGRWPTYEAMCRAFPKSKHLAIAIAAEDWGDCLDIERYDATPDQAPAWVRDVARPFNTAKPVLYASASMMEEVIAEVLNAGIGRHGVLLWSAHYSGKAHICGPATCSLVPEPMDGTQWTDQANGGRADQSLLADDFFPTALPAPQPVGELEMPKVFKHSVNGGGYLVLWPNGTYTPITDPGDGSALVAAYGSPVEGTLDASQLAVLSPAPGAPKLG